LIPLGDLRLRAKNLSTEIVSHRPPFGKTQI
jgi:hypothetical protein